MTFSEDSKIGKFDSEIQNLIDDCHMVQRNIDELGDKVSNISFEYNDKPNLFSLAYDSIQTLMLEACHFIHLSEQQLGSVARYQGKALKSQVERRKNE
jgi:hypothetical protein